MHLKNSLTFSSFVDVCGFETFCNGATAYPTAAYRLNIMLSTASPVADMPKIELLAWHRFTSLSSVSKKLCSPLHSHCSACRARSCKWTLFLPAHATPMVNVVSITCNGITSQVPSRRSPKTIMANYNQQQSEHLANMRMRIAATNMFGDEVENKPDSIHRRT